MKSQEDAAHVSFDSKQPLGLIAQDPLNAQHVPYISSMSIGPITRPCIDTNLCDPGTTSGQVPLKERMSAQAGGKRLVEMTLTVWSKRHKCLPRPREG